MSRGEEKRNTWNHDCDLNYPTGSLARFKSSTLSNLVANYPYWRRTDNIHGRVLLMVEITAAMRGPTGPTHF